MVELHFSLKVIHFLVIDEKIYQEIPSWLYHLIVDIIESVISVDDLLAKALQRFGTVVLVNNNLRGRLVSSLELPIAFDDSIKTVSVTFFIADFNLLTLIWVGLLGALFWVKGGGLKLPPV